MPETSEPTPVKCVNCDRTILHDDFVLHNIPKSEQKQGMGHWSWIDTVPYCLKCEGRDWYSPELSDEVKAEITELLELLDVPLPPPPPEPVYNEDDWYDYYKDIF